MSISRSTGSIESKVKQEFKENANYRWAEDQKFVLLGVELNIIMKSLQMAADTPEFRRNAAIYQGLAAINNLFKESIEQGLIKEEEEKK